MGFEAEVMDALRKGAEDAGGPNALALACGINLPTLTRWLSGDRQPKLKVLGQVMDYLGVTLSTTPRRPARPAQSLSANAPACGNSWLKKTYAWTSSALCSGRLAPKTPAKMGWLQGN